MKFDIDRLKNLDDDYNEKVLGEYQKQLVELFRESPEGQALSKTQDDAGYWVGLMIEMGYSYEGVSPSEMSVCDMEKILTELFPRKVSVFSEETRGIVPEFVAFWNYLKREYTLKQADAIIAFLREIEPRFPEIMNDSSRFGMAKSIVSKGIESGFDMTTEEGIAAFMLHYNSYIANTPNEPEGVLNALPLKRKSRVVPPPAGTRNQRKRMRRRN